ncbi:MAG: uroporphyrinogen-III C-methyltransferase [Firmicutes bacterium]|nr:uroporphyrinogen-III C-methyltransferase [Bacillota bacterium]
MFAGYVCFIGAGPGNPGLITRRGLEYFQWADLVLYDQLIPVSLLLEVKKGCRMIEVGKQGGRPSWDQDAINQLLITEAQAGQFVVRLKGGDPFLLGRGGEETQALSEAGVPYIIVPGVSSSYAVPAYAGIPVTDRRFCSGVTVTTGHKSEAGIGRENTERVNTFVILMPLANLKSIITGLIQQGWAAHTPAVVISQGTMPGQKLITGELASLSDLVDKAALSPPALLVVGDVVKLQETLSWNHHLPLAGKRILWTRAWGKDEPGKIKEFELYGAEVVRFPTGIIQLAPLEQLKRSFSEIQQYTWLLFTSSTAVEIFCQVLVELGWDWRQFARSRIAVIGKKTGQAMAERGRIPDLTATDSNSDGLLSTILKELTAGDSVSLCRARQTLPNLAKGLEEAGFSIKNFDLYEVAVPSYDSAVVWRIFSEPFDMVIHTSPSSVVNLREILSKAGCILNERTRFACLGKETAKTCERFGISPWLIPDEPDIEVLLDLILNELLKIR